MIIVTGTFDLADHALRDATVKATIPFQQATRDTEPGCHAYIISADPCIPGRIQMYELWEDESALAAHFQHANYTELIQALGSLDLAGSTAEKFAVSDAQPLYS
jgi:quinol monooxygenase YgiN